MKIVFAVHFEPRFGGKKVVDSDKKLPKGDSHGRKRKRKKSPGLRTYEEHAADELRGMIINNDLLYKVICSKLEEMGIYETEKGLSAKINAGTFSASFLFAVADAIDEITGRKPHVHRHIYDPLKNLPFHE